MYVFRIFDFEENKETFVEEQEHEKIEPLKERLIYYVQNMINKRMEIFKIDGSEKPILIMKGRCMERDTPTKIQIERVTTVYKK